MIAGCRFESCGSIGALIGADAAMLMNNRFEQNGGVGGVGIRILSTASHTRLVSNLLSSNQHVIHTAAVDTEAWGNIIVD